jgi:hypothetical protein
MPETPDNQVKRRGPGRPSLGLSKEGHVLVKMQPDLKRKMDQTAREREVSANELVRRAVALYCSPEELRADLQQLYDEDERNEPDLRKYRDDMRRNSKSPRVRARAGRSEPKASSGKPRTN